MISRTLILAALLAGPLASGCMDEEFATRPPEDPDEVAEGGDLAYAMEEEAGDITVHPVRDRLDLLITTTSPLSPDRDVDLAIEGVAREAIDSGEVVLTLPTKAMMGHVGEGRPEVPVEARWTLPPMAEGERWRASFTVPGAVAGYYQVLVNAYTHGPDGGPRLFDESHYSVWMYVSGTDGQLTRLFEDSIFPEGMRPAGSRPADGGQRPVLRGRYDGLDALA